MAMDDPLIIAVRKMAELPDKDKVPIRGKRYAEVHIRVQAFREAFGSRGRIISKVHQADEKRVLTETTISVFLDGQMRGWQVIGNDFAEEYRSSSRINATSAVENCLTSSIGRALASLGLGGGSYASFEEVDHAINEKASVGDVEEKEEEEEEEEEGVEALEEEGPVAVDEGFMKTIQATLELQDSHEGLRSWSQENETLLKGLPEAAKKTLREAYKQRAEDIMKNKEDE
jgi:hypothetical protein